MAVFEYIAKDQTGSTFTGSYEDISSVAVLRKELAKMDYKLVKASRKKEGVEKRKKIKKSQVVTFIYKFAGMCSAGISITRSLETIEEQTEDQAFKYVISDIKRNIEAGSSLKQAFEKHKGIFSDFLIGMVEAGETGGRLSETLELSAEYLEKQLDLKRKIMSAFAYPVVVSAACIVIVTCLLIFVIPVFSKIYKQLHIELPGPTQALVMISVLIRQWWWAILPVSIAAVFALKQLLKNPQLRVKWDRFKLNMPIFAKLNRMVVVSRFIRTFALLSSSGVSLIKSLEIASLVADNSEVSRITKDLQRSIEAGNTVAYSLKKHKLFGSMITQLADSGEQAGILAEMLNKGVKFMDKDIDRTINALLVKLEPAMTVIMGTIVGFILLGVYLPMFDYMSKVK